MRRWADATRHHQWEKAEQLRQQLMAQWLTPPVVDQNYLNDLLDRRMAVLERRERRRAIDNDEFDKLHEDVNS